MTRQQPKSPSKKMRDYRARLRARGLRPVQFWVPDTRSPEFATAARQQSQRVARSEAERQDLDFVVAIFDDLIRSIPE